MADALFFNSNFVYHNNNSPTSIIYTFIYQVPVKCLSNTMFLIFGLFKAYKDQFFPVVLKSKIWEPFYVTVLLFQKAT